jgi:hypothetical protein
MSEAKETCPTCGIALQGLACSACGVTWVRCSCGRMHAPYVKECPHCHATVPLGYLAELVSKELIDSPKQLRSIIARERDRYMEARHAKPPSAEPTITEISLMPASPAEQLPRDVNVQRSRVSKHNGQIKEQNRRVARRSIRDVQSSQSERLNPYWLQRQAAGPAYLLFAAIVISYLLLRLWIEFELSLWLLLAPVMMSIAAFIWMVALHEIEVRRRI